MTGPERRIRRRRDLDPHTRFATADLTTRPRSARSGGQRGEL